MGNGASRSVLENSLNEIISQSFTQVTFDAQDQMEVDQTIDIECTGEYVPYPGADAVPFESNTGCESCFKSIREAQIQQHEMIKQNWTQSSAPIPQSFNDEMTSYYYAAQNCVYSCKACVFSNFSQSANLSWKADYTFDASILTKMKSAISGNLQQSLTNNKGVLDSLAGVLGPNDNQKTITNLTNRVMNRITTSVMDSIVHQVSATQTIKLVGSEQVKNVNQKTAISTVFNVVQKLNLTNTILSEEEWAVQQKLYNSENTVGAFGEIIKKTVQDVAQDVQSTSFIILMAIVGLVVVAILGVSIFSIVQAHRAKVKQG